MELTQILHAAAYESTWGYLRGSSSAACLTLALPNTPQAASYILRYMVNYLFESDYYLNPAYLLGEYGGELTGWRAWDFMFKRYHLNPRSEVTGLRSDGKKGQLLLKELDMVAPIAIFAYDGLEALHPLAQITQLEIPEAFPSELIPPRLAQYLSPDI